MIAYARESDVLPQAALFLDRDGVILENRLDYLRSWEAAAFIPGALQAIARLRDLPLRIVIVTNQSAVGRGLVPADQVGAINLRMVEAVEHAGGRVDAVYMCPHHPEAGCNCRKPRPGLILQAAEELGLDLPRSTLVGDALSDLQAGHAAGVGRLALVRTGLGASQLPQMASAGLPEVELFDDLEQALGRLLPTSALP